MSDPHEPIGHYGYTSLSGYLHSLRGQGGQRWRWNISHGREYTEEEIGIRSQCSINSTTWRWLTSRKKGGHTSDLTPALLSQISQTAGNMYSPPMSDRRLIWYSVASSVCTWENYGCVHCSCTRIDVSFWSRRPGNGYCDWSVNRMWMWAGQYQLYVIPRTLERSM